MQKKRTMLDRRTSRGASTHGWLIVAALMLLALSLSLQFTPAKAGPDFQDVLCGSGSPPDYGFTVDRLQEHWTVNWRDYVSEQAVTEVDAVLDQLNADAIAQTMILFQAEEQVGVRVNCAVHFLRYMRLGLPAGGRKDNGFAFLIVVESGRIDVHYGVGLGLPALTASELTPINRLAEEAYATSGSMDEALLILVREFDSVSRRNYAPLIAPTPTPVMVDVPELPAGPLGVLALCGLLCVIVLVVMFVLWVAYKVARAGIEIGPYGTDPFGGGSSFGSGGWTRGGGGGWGGGGFRGGPTMRGGGGSGRSGRGN